MAKKPTYEELEQRIKELEKEAFGHKQAKEALQRITEEQSVILGTVPAMIFWIDREGTFVRANDAFAAALHTSSDDIKGKSLFDLYPEDMARKYYDDNMKVMESGAPKRGIEECVETPNDTIWVSTDKIPQRDEKGDIIGIIGFSQDITVRKRAEEELRKHRDYLDELVEERTAELKEEITERKQAEEALLESEQELSIIFHTAPVLMVVVDGEWRVRKSNRATEIFTGHSQEDMLGIRCGSAFCCLHALDHPEGCGFGPACKGCLIRGTALDTIETGTGRARVEALLAVERGGEVQTLTVLVSTKPLEMDNEQMVLVCLQDITERKQVEETLKQANEELSREQNQRKILSKKLIDLLEKDRRQIAMELHDHIGQILTSIKMNLEMIHEKLKPGHRELGAKITTAQEGIIKAIKDVKNISHGLRPAMLDALGVVSSVRGLFNEVQQATGIEIRFFSRGIPKRFEEEKELVIYRIAQEALTNIIRHARAKNIFVNLIKKDEMLSLSVEDDGVGFDQAKVMKSLKRKGPLGLLIMRERAEQLDGDFTLESQPGKGTHLLVEIPL